MAHLVGGSSTPNPAISLNSIRTALVISFASGFASCVFFFTSAAFEHDRRTSVALAPPAWTLALVIGFALLPYIVCLLLLFRRRYESIVVGAGIASGIFGAAVLASPYAILAMLLSLGLSASDRGVDRGLLVSGIALLVFLASSVWIVWSAFRIGKLRWKPFCIALCATGLYVYIGFHQLVFAAYKGQRQVERRRAEADMKLYMPYTLARQRIVSLTACLLRNRMEHPDGGFPASLGETLQRLGCNATLEDHPIPDFAFDYEPLSDTASGRTSDFRLTAIPREKGIMNRNPLMSDSRGIVFVYYGWTLANSTPAILVMPSDRVYSQIDALRSNIERCIEEHGNGVAPSKLNAQCVGALGYEMPIIRAGGTQLATRDFEISYIAPASNNQNKFALSVQCRSYGHNCLRSFFSDYDGTLHATGEPRAATAEDPAPLLCENGVTECKDVSWAVP